MAERTVAVLIAGPTASGKSAYAVERAMRSGGVVVNTDSMQVYDVLSVLTARPQPNEMKGVPHYLFGHVDPSVRYSTGAWVDDVSGMLKELKGQVAEIIFVGGTGLYFKTLTDGFSEIPEIPAAVFDDANAQVEGLGREGRRELLARLDPQMVERLGEPDPQRVARAIAVKNHTGRSLAEWQSNLTAPLLSDMPQERILLNPPREVLNARIASRFETMFESGAVDEVKALLDLNLSPDLPAMKAIGVREIRGLLNGEYDEQTAIERAVIATRQYAKRQRTWFRNQMSDWRNATQGPGLDV